MIKMNKYKTHYQHRETTIQLAKFRKEIDNKIAIIAFFIIKKLTLL